MSIINRRLRQIADQLNPRNKATEATSKIGEEVGNVESILGLLEFIRSPMGSLTARKFGQGGKSSSKGGGTKKTTSSRRGSGGSRGKGGNTSTSSLGGDEGISAIIAELRNIRSEIVTLQDIAAKQANLTKFQVDQMRKQNDFQKEAIKVSKVQAKKKDFNEQVKRHRESGDATFDISGFGGKEKVKEKGLMESVLSFMGLRAIGSTLLGGLGAMGGAALGAVGVFGAAIARFGIIGVIVASIFGGIQKGWHEYTESGDLKKSALTALSGVGETLWNMIGDSIKWLIGLLPDKFRDFGNDTVDSITTFLSKTHDVIEGIFGEMFADFTKAAAGMVGVGIALRAIFRPISTLKLVFKGMRTALRTIASGIGAATRGVGAANRAIQRATSNLRNQTAARASSRPTAGNGAPRQSGTRPQSTHSPRSAGPRITSWFDRAREGVRNTDWRIASRGAASIGARRMLGSAGILWGTDVNDGLLDRHETHGFNLNTPFDPDTMRHDFDWSIPSQRPNPAWDDTTGSRFDPRMPLQGNAWENNNDQTSLQNTFNDLLTEDNVRSVFENLSRMRSIPNVGRQMGIGDLAVQAIQDRVSNRVRGASSGLPDVSRLLETSQIPEGTNRDELSSRIGNNNTSSLDSIVRNMLENSDNSIQQASDALVRNFGDAFNYVRTLHDIVMDNDHIRQRLDPNQNNFNNANPLQVDVTEGTPISSIKNPATRTDFVANSMSRGQRQLNQMAALASNPMSAGQSSRNANVVNNRTTVNNNQYTSSTPSTRQSNPLSGSNVMVTG